MMTRFKTLENKFFNRLGKDLSKPINPYVVSLIGIFGIVYALYLYIPKQHVVILRTTSLFEDKGLKEVLFFGAVGLGIWLLSVPFWAKTIDKMILPLRLMSGYWISVAIIVGIGNWTTQSIIAYVFISLFCLVCAANFSMNRNRDFYKDIFS